MIIVDYLSKSYHRVLQDIPHLVNHPKRFLITLNGPTAVELVAVTADIKEASKKRLSISTAIGDKSSETAISNLFNEAHAANDILFLEKSDLVFTQTVSVKKSYEKDENFDLNNLLKNIAKHRGMVILANEEPRVLSSSMSSRVDILIRFPNF